MNMSETLVGIAKKPNFFIVGAPKSGTTAMYHYLGQHPEIFMPEWKEPYYFGSDLWFRKGRFTREEYLALFSPTQDEKRLGEASVLYLYSKRAASEIKEFCPTAKIIIMLRNPVDMIYSWHTELLYQGSEIIADFEDALDESDARKKGSRLPDINLVDCLFYHDIPQYAQQVQRYFECFGHKNVHIIIFDDFRSDTATMYQETLAFLGVATNFQPNFQMINPHKRRRSQAMRRVVRSRRAPLWLRILAPQPIRRALLQVVDRYNTTYEQRPPMDSALRLRLQSEFAPDVEQLSALLRRDLSDWCSDSLRIGLNNR